MIQGEISKKDLEKFFLNLYMRTKKQNGKGY